MIARPPAQPWILCLLSGLLFLSAHCAAQSPAPAQTTLPVLHPNDPLSRSARDYFYNLDFDRAVQQYTELLTRHPDDPFAVNHVLTAVLFRELYRMGSLNTGEYVSDTFIHAPHRPADPAVKAQIKGLAQKAFQLEDARLQANPKDVDALYARGVTRAQYATYTGMIERAWFSALRSAEGARKDHERVLELAPQNNDAKLVVGTHNYVVGNLPLALRASVSLFGMSGNKEKGLLLLRQCADANGETSVDAKTLMVLFLRREHRYDEALPIVRELIQNYPRNVLMPLEEGNLLRAQGHYEESAAVYRRIWQAGREGKYDNQHYEIASLSLAELLRAGKDYSGASSAYDQVSEAPSPDPEILQKANLGAGEMYDVLKRRDLALKRYQSVVSTDANTNWADTARKYMKEPYPGD